jgi:hypothetical protein
LVEKVVTWALTLGTARAIVKPKAPTAAINFDIKSLDICFPHHSFSSARGEEAGYLGQHYSAAADGRRSFEALAVARVRRTYALVQQIAGGHYQSLH